MPIIASDTGGGNYQPAPAGVHPAVCIDVVDLGMVEQTFEGKTSTRHMARVVWEIDAEMDDGKRFHVNKRYTCSLHERAALRRDLEGWRAKPFEESELKGFDLEKLIGVPALLNVVQAQRDGKTWANVQAIMPLPKAYARLTPAPGYVRQKDRPQQQAGVEPPPLPDVPPVDDEDSVPF
jgi:hypothetical protein